VSVKGPAEMRPARRPFLCVRADVKQEVRRDSVRHFGSRRAAYPPSGGRGGSGWRSGPPLCGGHVQIGVSVDAAR